MFLDVHIHHGSDCLGRKNAHTTAGSPTSYATTYHHMVNGTAASAPVQAWENDEWGRVSVNYRELVETAIRNYEHLPPMPFGEDMPEDQSYLATPDRLAFALGWIVANAIVNARYADSAIDALPVFHPSNGWDRFLLSRRVVATAFANENANTHGMILLDGPDAPRITSPGGRTKLALGGLLRRDPDAAIAEALALFPRGKLLPLDLGMRWKDRQRVYPHLYNAVTEIIVEHPGTVAAREIFVDNQPVDGAYHPLYLHQAAKLPEMVYDWFLVQHEDRATFFRIHGHQSIYETERKGWATVKKQLVNETPEDMKRRILAWLRLEGQPQPATVD